MKAEDKKYYKRLAITGGVIALLILVIVIVTIPKPGAPVKLDAIGEASLKYEKSTIELLKARLNLYYVYESEFPRSLETLMAYDKFTAEDKEQLQEGLDRIKDLDYKVRGDEQAYRITYTDTAKQTVTYDGNYQEDYQ